MREKKKRLKLRQLNDGKDNVEVEPTTRSQDYDNL